MAQATVRTLGVDGRSGGEVTKMLLPTGHWTENAADVTREYKVHIEAKMVLDRHAAAVSIDLRQTRYLKTLRTDLKNSFIALTATWDTMKGDVVDGRAFEEMNGWVANTEERVNDTLLDFWNIYFIIAIFWPIEDKKSH